MDIVLFSYSKSATLAKLKEEAYRLVSNMIGSDKSAMSQS